MYKLVMIINNVNSYILSSNTICLPNGNNLDVKKIDYICDTLNKILFR